MSDGGGRYRGGRSREGRAGRKSREEHLAAAYWRVYIEVSTPQPPPPSPLSDESIDSFLQRCCILDRRQPGLEDVESMINGPRGRRGRLCLINGTFTCAASWQDAGQTVTSRCAGLATRRPYSRAAPASGRPPKSRMQARDDDAQAAAASLSSRWGLAEISPAGYLIP